MEQFARMEIEMPLVSKAAIKIAIYLFYHVDVTEFLEIKNEKMDRVIENVKSLPVPLSIQGQVLNVIKPLGLYMRKAFVVLHCVIVSPACTTNQWPCKMNWPKLLCWKNIGVIDNKRTAEKILSSGVLDTFSAFRLACFSCIEHEIIKLWCDSRRQIHRHFGNLFEYESLAVIFWISYFKRETKELIEVLPALQRDILTMAMTDAQRENNAPITAAEFGFVSGIIGGNIEFCKYHARKIEDSKLNNFMLVAAKQFLKEDVIASASDGFRLAFSHLNSTQQVEIFAERTVSKLLYLLSWPLQDFFMDIAIQLYDILSESEFLVLLFFIFYNVRQFKHSNVFKVIFVDFWENSRSRHKSYVLVDWIYAKLFQQAFRRIEFEGKPRLEQFEMKLLELMFRSGCVVLEVLVGECYLDILLNIFDNFILIETAVNRQTFLNSIVELKSTHTCGTSCHLTRFDEEVMFLSFELLSNQL